MNIKKVILGEKVPDKDDPNYKEAKTWSLVYYLNEEYTQQ